MAKANAVDQRSQAVLYLMDKLDSGIDGIRGERTTMALRAAGQSFGMGSMASVEDRVKIEAALRDKLRDPAFRAAALEKLRQVDPPTKDSIVATQVVLAAAGHNIPRDPNTHMFSGKMDEKTQYALAHTEDGKMDRVSIAAAAGLNSEGANVVANGGRTNPAASQFAQGKDAIILSASAMNMSFQSAALGVVAPAEPVASFENKSRGPVLGGPMNG